MRYHLFKTSRTKNLLIGDSQAKKLNIANFNILSIPGAQVKHVYNLEFEGHPQVTECCEVCKCLSWTEEDYDGLCEVSNVVRRNAG